MSEYVHLFRTSYPPKSYNGKVDLCSETFRTKEDADAFASIFTHNYYTKGEVQSVPGGFCVMCKNVENRLISSSFREDINMYEVANWKYDSRGPEKAKRYFALPKSGGVFSHILPKNQKYIRNFLIFAAIIIFFVVFRSDHISAVGDETLAKVIGVCLFLFLIAFFVAVSSSNHKKSCYTWDEIDSMDGQEFECFVASLIVKNGLGSTQGTPVTGDFGVDIILNSDTAIQCKRSSKNLGINPLQEVYAGMKHYGCKNAIVITNAYFTSNAVTLAEELNISLWDRDVIGRMK